jgi:hypothetical protein
MMKFIRTFDDYETPMVPVELNVTKEGIAVLANEFMRALGKDYDLRKDRAYDPKIGNDAWYTERFFEWSENSRTPSRIIYFYHDEEGKNHEPHMAILLGDLVLDFAHKKLSKDRKEKFSILKIKDYEKYGFKEYEILDEFPSWVDDINPLKSK